MLNTHEGWWECVDPACGEKIQFLMIAKAVHQSKPTCFCGSRMRRPYREPKVTQHGDNIVADLRVPDAKLSETNRMSAESILLSLVGSKCLVPEPDV